MSHYREVCENCERVIRQCRCPGGTTTAVSADKCPTCSKAKRAEEDSQPDLKGQVPALQCDEAGSNVVQASGSGVYEVQLDRNDSEEDAFWRRFVAEEGIVRSLEMVEARIGLLVRDFDKHHGWDSHAESTRRLVVAIQRAVGN